MFPELLVSSTQVAPVRLHVRQSIGGALRIQQLSDILDGKWRIKMCGDLHLECRCTPVKGHSWTDSYRHTSPATALLMDL